MNEVLRQCLEDLDVARARSLWASVAPHLPQPRSDEETLVVMHMARTSSESMRLRARAYSHAWLRDHGYPSQLPDYLKVRAERLYPRVVDAVGISVNFGGPDLKPAATLIQSAMSDKVEEMYASGDSEPARVREEMLGAGRRERCRLFGSWGTPSGG